MKLIRVVHPTAGEALIPEISLPHHVRAGWRRAEDLGVTPREVQSEQEPPSRRRRVAEQKSEES